MSQDEEAAQQAMEGGAQAEGDGLHYAEGDSVPISAQEGASTPTASKPAEAGDTPGAFDGNPLTNVRKASCDMCTQIKVKCSGEEPCKRCNKKQLICVYSLAKKRGPPKGKKRTGPSKRQRITNSNAVRVGPTNFNPNISLEALRARIQSFSEDRQWEGFHTPRSLLLAMVGEVGELSELFQWREDARPGLPGWQIKERDQVADELADVLIYLIRLSDRCGIDLGDAAINKIQKNEIKFPKEKVRGNPLKHTAYVGRTHISEAAAAAEADAVAQLQTGGVPQMSDMNMDNTRAI